MKHSLSTKDDRRGGFTMVELMLVIAVIAIVATLVTGAAMKALKTSRERRVETTIAGLQMALGNYRARENKWPEALTSKTSSSGGTVWFHGIQNAEVFKDLIKGGDDGTTRYLDGAALLVTVNGQRMSLLQALQKSKTSEKAIGFPYPPNPSVFGYFCVEYDPLTDRVKIHLGDMRRSPYGKDTDRVYGDHTCPDGYWVKVN